MSEEIFDLGFSIFDLVFARNNALTVPLPAARDARRFLQSKIENPKLKISRRPNFGNNGSRRRGDKRHADMGRNFASNFYLPVKPLVDPGDARLARALQKAGQQHNHVMKKLPSLSAILAAGAAGVALAKLGNADLLARVPGDAVFAAALFLGILAFAAHDLARCIAPLKLQGTKLRPPLPASGAPRPAAYGIRRRRAAIVERVAA